MARAPSNVSDQGQKQAIVGNSSPDRLALQAEVSATLHARSNSTPSSSGITARARSSLLAISFFQNCKSSKTARAGRSGHTPHRTSDRSGSRPPDGRACRSSVSGEGSRRRGDCSQSDPADEIRPGPGRCVKPTAAPGQGASGGILLPLRRPAAPGAPPRAGNPFPAQAQVGASIQEGQPGNSGKFNLGNLALPQLIQLVTRPGSLGPTKGRGKMLMDGLMNSLRPYTGQPH